MAVGQVITWTIRSSVLINQPFEPHFSRQLHMGAYSSKINIDLNRKLSQKRGVGRYSIVGPLSRGYSLAVFVNCYMHPLHVETNWSLRTIIQQAYHYQIIPNKQQK